MTLEPVCRSRSSRRTAAYTIGLLLALLLLGCASRSHNIRFSIPREEFFSTARTIVLAPVMAPREIAIEDSLLARFDLLIEEVLVEAGYHCVPSTAHADAWERILAEMGGIYDSTTGIVDELRFDVAKEQLRLDLVDLYQADYLLFPEIWIVEVWTSAGVAEWDGTSQAVVGIGTRILNFLDAIIGQYEGFLEPVTVEALSLDVVVEDMEGTEIFEYSGGIEVLKEAEDHEQNAGSRTFQAVLADSMRTRHAVEFALSPFLEGRSGAD